MGKKSQFCKKGHDKTIVGTLDGSCNREKGSKTPLEYLLKWPKVTEKYSLSEEYGS